MIDLELVVAPAAHGAVVTPFLEIELVELVVEDQLGAGKGQEEKNWKICRHIIINL